MDQAGRDMGASPAIVCPIMWVNQAQAWDDGYCTRPVLRISGAGEEVLRVPQPGHAEKLPEGVIVPGIYIPHKGTSERIEALSLGDTGNEVIVVAGWPLFAEQFREVATQPFRLLGVGQKELDSGKYAVRSDIIVPVQRGSQVVMARCADCLVYLASVGPRAILGLPFFARYGLVVLPDPGCFALVEVTMYVHVHFLPSCWCSQGVRRLKCDSFALWGWPNGGVDHFFPLFHPR